MTKDQDVPANIFVLQVLTNCTICGKEIKEDDLEDLLVSGRGFGTVANNVHGPCWDKNLPPEEWKNADG